jgi:hypothetical protein
MKKISEVEEKPFTSSLNIVQKPAVKRGGGGQRKASPSPLPYSAADPWILHLKTT